MSSFPTSDDLYVDLQRRLPAWVFSGLFKVRVDLQSPLLGESLAGELLFLQPARRERVPKDLVYGPLATLFGDHYGWLEDLLDQVRLTTAGGEWLELHAAERGTWRRDQEDDERLRARLRKVAECCTARALKAAAEEVVAGAAEAFTLRDREGVWDRSFGDTDRRYGGRVLPRRPREGWGTGYFDVGRWDMHTFGDYGVRGPFGDPSGWLVAVVIVDRQMRSPGTFFDRAFAGSSFWGDRRVDTARYRALRQVLEERRAAGVEVRIWIRETI